MGKGGEAALARVFATSTTVGAGEAAAVIILDDTRDSSDSDCQQRLLLHLVPRWSLGVPQHLSGDISADPSGDRGTSGGGKPSIRRTTSKSWISTLKSVGWWWYPS
nr:unnamed protein product [Digitaria exilis]